MALNIEKNDTVSVWKKIREQVESIGYGSVIITVHDGKITQVETSKKIRFKQI